MKKLALILAGTAALTFTGAGVAMAETVCTPAGCVGANEGGYLVYADGDAGNPDPADGYIYVTASGACADDNGSPGLSESPTCAP